MEVALTVHQPHSAALRDVQLVAPADSDLRDVLQSVARHCGYDGAPPPASIGGAIVTSATGTLADSTLRPGGILRFDAAPEASFADPTLLGASVTSGPGAGASLKLTRGSFTLGRDRNADLMIDDPDVSRSHAELDVRPDGIWVRDLGSRNGTRLDGEPVGPTPRRIESDQRLRVGASEVTVHSHAVDPALATHSELITWIRPTGADRDSAAAPVEYPTIPDQPSRPTLQLATHLLPACLSLALALAMHNTMFAAFALLSPVTAMSAFAVERWRWRQRIRRSSQHYLEHEAAADAALAESLAVEAGHLSNRFPDAATLLRNVEHAGSLLFQRTPDTDGLTVRIGLGSRHAETCAVRAGMRLPARTLHDSPIAIDLSRQSLYISGPRARTTSAIRWMICQLATLHSPADVELFVITADAGEWNWLRWLPSFACAYTSVAEAQLALASETNESTADALRGFAHETPRRRRLVVLDAPESLSPAAAMRALGSGDGTGLIVLVDDAVETTSPGARARYSPTTGELVLRRGADPPICIRGEGVSSAYASSLARDLARYRDVRQKVIEDDQSVAAGIARAAEDAESLSARWSSSAGARVVLGSTSEGAFAVDLDVDGPHALIAGTTGSGKSELLRTLILGLAMGAPADEMTFLLFDFKGGAAFQELAELPHVTAVVTDLDSAAPDRALRSLRSEIRTRERALSAAGVTHHCDYRRLPRDDRSSMARLIVVVDEFATLAEDAPDFLHGLIDVARRGRSLGVHLVLATQRPSSAVSAEIRANVALRIALRVADGQDSFDVIGCERAAHLPRSSPGAGFALTATEGLVRFQADRIEASAGSQSEVTVHDLDEWNRPVADPRAGRTSGLSVPRRFAAAAHRAASLRGIPAPPPIFLPELPALLRHDTFPRHSFARNVIPIALRDVPDEQTQYPLTLDLVTSGACGVIGSPGSGRTSTLTSILLSAATAIGPGELDCYIIDCASGALAATAERVPHVQASLTAGDPAAISRLFELLESDAATRRREVGSEQQRGTASGVAQPRRSPPMVLVLLDGWDEFTAMSDAHDAGATERAAHRLLGNAHSAHMCFVAAGGRALLSTRTAAAMQHRFVLSLTDASDYLAAGIPAADVPRHRLPPGRALVVGAPGEAQMYLASSDHAGEHRHDQIDRAGSPLAAGKPAARVRGLPPVLDARTADRLGLPASAIGIGGDTASPIELDLTTTTRRLLVVGAPASGRSTALAALGRAATTKGLGTLFLTGHRGNGVASPTLRTSATDLDRTSHADLQAFLTGNGSHRVLLIDDLIEDNASLSRSQILCDAIENWHGTIIATVSSEALHRAYAGPTALMLAHGSALLLQPTDADRERLGLPRAGTRPTTCPGRGELVRPEDRASNPRGVRIQVRAE